MERLVIAGGGFAGVSALKTLAKVSKKIRNKIEILLLDKKLYFEFLPMLPDVSGGWLGPDRLRIGLDDLAKSAGAKFLHKEVQELDLNGKIIKTTGGDVHYDYLILATGTETNFYGNDEFQKRCSRVDNVADAISIRDKILDEGRKGHINIAVVGGGYTGIEVASNLDILLKKNRIKHTACIVERAQEVLMMLPEWTRNEVKRELRELKIETLCDEDVTDYDGNTLTLGSGKKIQDAFCVWAAGVKTPHFIDKMELPKEKSRIVVDKYLRPEGCAGENVFVAGDSAYFSHTKEGKPLRMAVMFSMGQGKIAAQNVMRSMNGKALSAYNPVDLGYLIPVANGNAPGIVLGANVHGFLGYIMHYFMCIYRSEPGKRYFILKDLLRKISKKKGESNE